MSKSDRNLPLKSELVPAELSRPDGQNVEAVDKQRAKKAMPISPGRPKGSPNRTTRVLKDAILFAAELAGGEDGLDGYLKKQAIDYPVAFMGLLGKVLPLQLTGADGGPIQTEEVTSVDASRLTQAERDTLRHLLLLARGRNEVD